MKRIQAGTLTHDWGMWIDNEADLHAKYDMEFVENYFWTVEEQTKNVWYGIIAKLELDSGVV